MLQGFAQQLLILETTVVLHFLQAHDCRVLSLMYKPSSFLIGILEELVTLFRLELLILETTAVLYFFTVIEL